MPHGTRERTPFWASSKFQRTARPKVSPNASRPWRWIEILLWRMRSSVTPSTQLGRAAETEAHVNEALRLSPRDTFAGYWMVWVGIAKLQLSADAEAVTWLRQGLEGNHNYPAGHFSLAAALALLGSQSEARAAAKADLRSTRLSQSAAIARAHMSDNPTYLAGRERIYEGMRIAGVPEG